MTRMLTSLFRLGTLAALLLSQLAWAQADRVVSLAPNWSHTVAELGAMDRLVGVTRYARFPAALPEKVAAGELAVVGGFTDIDVERVMALEPDLVLTATGLQEGLAEVFKARGIEVIHMEERSLAEVYDKIHQLGLALELEPEAGNMVTAIQQQLIALQDELRGLPQSKVYYELNYFYKCVPGNDSYMAELLRLVGAEPILADGEGMAPMVSWSQVVEANPDVILIPTWPGAEPAVFSGPNAGNGTTTIEEVMGRDKAKGINAVSRGAVRFIDSARTKQAGPSIPEAARLLAEAIHGRQFGSRQGNNP